jgi:flagellar FliL protein
LAIIDDTAPIKKDPSMVLQIALLAGLTVLAIGIGWGSGMYLVGQQAPAVPAGEHATAQASEVRLAEAHQAMGVVYLETDHDEPFRVRPDIWVRLELALVFEGDQPDLLISRRIVHQDILAYLRTVRARQVEGPSGFQHLRSDLDERARIRSEGKVTAGPHQDAPVRMTRRLAPRHALPCSSAIGCRLRAQQFDLGGQIVGQRSKARRWVPSSSSSAC